MTPEGTARDWETFDTLENLIAYLSPAFDETRVSSLMSQLQQLAVERGEGGQEEPKAKRNEARTEDRMEVESDGGELLDGDDE